MKRILVIVPAFNEGGSIRQTLEEIKSAPFPLDVVVVDDGSRDETRREALSSGVDVVSLPFNLGIGAAVQTGLVYARHHSYDVAVRVDGDGQHDVHFLEPLLRPVLDQEADLVIGSRFLPPFLGYRSSFIRRIGILFFANLISGMIHARITDPTSGFQAFGRKAIQLFSRSYPCDFPEPESIVVAQKVGLRVREVPVQMRKRAAGRSSIRYLITLYYMIKVTFAILIYMLKKNREGGAGER
ncbi:MAG TPA: glycosyltransferase family 2 protein [Candidatus Omnitrophota bacterium]|nr:glycosyltransferase family 2 protein [Candidatus Omnitrophota bacterium]HPB67651.1 glycosyltransferase family 2 protein [Candidatus Omnitrophota bacterium]HQO58455.1 glycosyltransferase family 2 protein [Candidatus Omnitrophota bacterium]HQP11560.1 glycosyltransferase family 2 protein [Candidatus Omnitrophota bacterium]